MGRLPLRRKAPVLLGLVLITLLSSAPVRLYLGEVFLTGIDSSMALSPGEPRYWGPPFTPERVAGAAEPLVVLEAASIEEEIERETRWLIACQMPDGAIAQTPLGEKIVPYFANFAAKALVDIDPGRARRYMDWYLDHLNRPDRFGLAGTVYDYELSEEGWVPTLEYDSADSYAATFLSLASHYLAKTGDRDFIESNLDDFGLVASVLVALQDKDGLTFVTPGSSTKYLMDNCEVYRGLIDWAEALLLLGRPEVASQMTFVAENVRLGIERVFYSAYRGQYAHTVSWYGKRYPKAGRWYPDAVSQLYLITEGVLRTDDQRAYRIWSYFNEQFPAWNECGAYDGFPWAKVALASARMGDTDRADQFLAWVAEEFGRKARPYPWYVLESAHIVDLYGEMHLAPSEANPGAGGQSSPQTSEAS
ncbi:MAG: hypothetical protein ACM3WU_09620 [Bacillota bacterium]